MNVDTGEFRALSAQVEALREELREQIRDVARAVYMRDPVDTEAARRAPTGRHRAAGTRGRPSWLRVVDGGQP